MTFQQYIIDNGLKTAYIAKKLGVCCHTIYRIVRGRAVSPELADKIQRVFSPDIEINISQSPKNHIRRRKVVK